MKRIYLLIFALLPALEGFAQEEKGPANQWSLQECIEYAREHNLQVKQSQLGLLSEKVELVRSKADLYPTLNAGANYNYSVGRNIDPFTNEVVDRPTSQQSYYLSSDVALFNGFRKQYLIKQNKASLEAVGFELAGTINNISLQVISAYTRILFNRELLETAERRLEATGLQQERTAKQVEVGVLPQASLFEIQAQYASDELAVTEAQNNFELALLNLKQLLRLPAEESVNIVDPEIELEFAEVFPVSAEEIYEVAEDTQPVINAVDAWVVSSEYGLKAAKGALYPTIAAQGDVFSSYSNTATVPGDFSYFDQLDLTLRRSVSLRLNIPIFNGLSARSTVSRARIAQDRAQLQAQIARQELRETIELAVQDVKAAALTYRSTLNQVKSLEEAFRSAEQRFNLGAANAVDYNISKTNLDVARSNLIRAKYDYIFKTEILDFYLNEPLSFE